MGLEFPFTPEAMPGRRRKTVTSGRKTVDSGGRMSVSLRCSSSVSTVNAEMQTTETHHQKSAEHLSFGSFFSSSADTSSISGTGQRIKYFNHVLLTGTLVLAIILLR